jgi:hypothetical protein
MGDTWLLRGKSLCCVIRCDAHCRSTVMRSWDRTSVVFRVGVGKTCLFVCSWLKTDILGPFYMPPYPCTCTKLCWTSSVVRILPIDRSID